MHELSERLRDCRLDRVHVRLLGASLPGSEELDALIGELIEAGDEAALTALMLAMAAAGRPIDARHLAGAAPLLLGLDHLAVAALHAQGDVVDALIEAVRQKQCGWEREAFLLLIAAWICRKREPEQPVPEDLIPHARRLARETRHYPLMAFPLFALARVVEDSGLHAVLDGLGPRPPESLTARLTRDLCERPAQDPLAGLPERADHVLHEGGTLRRSVSKIGRNEPCPCGSGRKYKRCCYEKDQERLRHSSEIAGVTTGEIEDHPELFLTEERLLALRSHKLARLRIEQVPSHLQGLVLKRLAMFGHADTLMAAWEKVGWREDLGDVWEDCMYDLVRERARGAIARLIALRGVAADDDVVPVGARLLLLEEQPAEYLRVVEEIALEDLNGSGELESVDLAFAMVEGAYPGLGTLVARGAAVTGSPLDAMMLVDSLGTVRDRFNLPPEDPAERVLEALFDLPEAMSDGQREELEATRREMEVSAAEVSRLRKQLQETSARLEREQCLAAQARSKPPMPSSQRVPAAPPATGPDVAALQKRVAELKSALSERHAERNALRRELSQAVSEAEALRDRRPVPDASEVEVDLAAEEQALVHEEAAIAQPPRLPVFPPRFDATLESFPESVQRATLRLIGRLAAGEGAAYAGMRRLRVCRDICRVRVGADHRLFFRLEPGRMEVLDLINRSDFERWLRRNT